MAAAPRGAAGQARRARLGGQCRITSTTATARSRSSGCAPLLSTAGMSFVSVQRDPRDGDREALGDQALITDLGGELADFSDTAAVLSLCDLVITVDTSVAHLAGALGRPLWILLPFWPDWRWTLDRDASPWYPTRVCSGKGRMAIGIR